VLHNSHLFEVKSTQLIELCPFLLFQAIEFAPGYSKTSGYLIPIVFKSSHV